MAAEGAVGEARVNLPPLIATERSVGVLERGNVGDGLLLIELQEARRDRVERHGGNPHMGETHTWQVARYAGGVKWQRTQSEDKN